MATRMLKVKLEENNLALEEEFDQIHNNEELHNENNDNQDQVSLLSAFLWNFFLC